MNSKFMEWLKDFKGAFNDASFEALGGTGSWNDRFVAWLRGMGQVGAADDMLHGWLAGQGLEGSVNDMLNDYTPPPPVDKLALAEALASASELSAADYTPNSWAVLASAVSAGQAVLDDEDATQQEVDDAADAVEAAMVALVPRAITTNLELAIAEGIAVDEGLYTPESYAVLSSSITAGNAVLGNLNATQSQVDSATQDILGAIDGLVPVATQCVSGLAPLPAPMDGAIVEGNKVTIDGANNAASLAGAVSPEISTGPTAILVGLTVTGNIEMGAVLSGVVNQGYVDGNPNTSASVCVFANSFVGTGNPDTIMVGLPGWPEPKIIPISGSVVHIAVLPDGSVEVYVDGGKVAITQSTAGAFSDGFMIGSLGEFAGDASGTIVSEFVTDAGSLPSGLVVGGAVDICGNPV